MNEYCCYSCRKNTLHLYYFYDSHSHREASGHKMSNGKKDRFREGPPWLIKLQAMPRSFLHPENKQFSEQLGF